MLLRRQKLLDSSTHILNLILWMPSFRAKFAVSRFSGDLERTRVFVSFSVKYRRCPFLKRLKSVK